MMTQLAKAIDGLRAVRRENRAWVHHLTGEGPATVRRQREAILKALAVAPRVGVTGRASSAGAPGPREAPTALAISWRRTFLSLR